MPTPLPAPLRRSASATTRGRRGVVGPSWYFDFASDDGSLGYVRLGLYPGKGWAWYWATVVGEGRPLVIVVDHEVAPPREGSLEVRAEGLWADHTVEVPFDHVTLGCEAFALGTDDPAEVYGAGRGDRVPFGLGLEWETAGEVYPYPPGTYPLRDPLPGAATCWWATSASRWTPSASATTRGGLGLSRSWAGPGRPARPGGRHPLPWHRPARPGRRGRAVPPGLHPGPGPAAGGSGPHRGDRGAGRARLPDRGRLRAGALRLAIEPVITCWTTRPAGSAASRALCRFTDVASGRRGVSWTEWSQPPPR